jgi:hypothetical protein
VRRPRIFFDCSMRITSDSFEKTETVPRRPWRTRENLPRAAASLLGLCRGPIRRRSRAFRACRGATLREKRSQTLQRLASFPLSVNDDPSKMESHMHPERRGEGAMGLENAFAENSAASPTDAAPILSEGIRPSTLIAKASDDLRHLKRHSPAAREFCYTSSGGWATAAGTFARKRPNGTAPNRTKGPRNASNRHQVSP